MESDDLAGASAVRLLNTDDPGTNLLVVSYARPGMSTGILHGGAYTPIRWDPHTASAAW